jgi:hypothetical protein
MSQYDLKWWIKEFFDGKFSDEPRMNFYGVVLI